MRLRDIWILVIASAQCMVSAAGAPGPHPLRQQIGALRQELAGKRVGLLTNPTGVDENFQFIADELVADTEIEMVCFFAPEHGLRGDQQAGAGNADYTDAITGLPVYSLYGARSRPTAEQLDTIDVMVFDIQDVGTRFYTFVWTMAWAMEECAKNDTAFLVFDRPNPIGCDRVEGSPIPFNGGLVGPLWPGQPFGVPTRHGLTAGELATLVNTEWLSPQADLTVVPIPGYLRPTTFDEIGYPWVYPSPNMPTIDTATVYPGLGVFEGLNVSEGRGTTRPFELIGAPFINGVDYAAALNAVGLPGVKFRSAWFEPVFDDYAGQRCGGVQVHVTDRATFQPIRTGITMVQKAVELYPEDITMDARVGRLMGVPNLEGIIADQSYAEIEASWQERLADFMVMRERNLIYPGAAADQWSLK